MGRFTADYWLHRDIPIVMERDHPPVYFQLGNLIQAAQQAVEQDDWQLIANAMILAEQTIEAELDLDLTDAAKYAAQQIAQCGAQLVENRYGPQTASKKEKGYYGLKNSYR